MKAVEIKPSQSKSSLTSEDKPKRSFNDTLIVGLSLLIFLALIWIWTGRSLKESCIHSQALAAWSILSFGFDFLNVAWMRRYLHLLQCHLLCLIEDGCL